MQPGPDLSTVLPGHLRDRPTKSQKAGYAPGSCTFFCPFSRSLSVIFGGYTSNHFNDQLSVGLLVQLVKALHPNLALPGMPEFFLYQYELTWRETSS